MSISAKPTEKVFKSLLAVTLSVSLCPLAPAGQAQADEAVSDGSETNSSPASVNDGSEASIPYASANDSDALPGDSDDGIAPERDALPGDFDDDIDPQSVDSSDPIVDWTTCGTARWTIDAGGCLTIAPMEGTDNGELEIWVLCDEVPWYNYRNSITSAKVAGKIATQTTALMFNDCPKLASLDLSGLDTSDVTNMSNMFSYCWSLTSLDLSPLDTSNVTNMSSMLRGCSRISSFDLSPLDTSNVTDMSYMLSGCSKLTSLDLSSFDTSRTGEMVSIFSGCLSLRTVKLGAGFTFTGRWTGRICNLPAISDLNGYTGLWVSSADGEAYKPNAIPNNVAAVYTAQQKPGVVMGDISSAIVSDIPEQTCTGLRIEPEVEVTLDGKTLVRGVDFRVSCTNNIKVGTATATIIGIGDYEGVIGKHFSIKKAPTPIFADVDYSSWYGDAVTFVAEKDLVTGYSDSGLFGVGNALTRAQLATILYRNANPDALPDFRPRNTTGMPDVEGFTWYTAGVNWAVENGVINGYADGEGNRVAFGPDDSMTLEQLVTAIANLSADEEDLPGTGETAAILRPFRDRWSVSPWARPSMAWAAQKGLVAGYDEPDGKHLRPSENISRERAVVILMRAFELGILE